MSKLSIPSKVDEIINYRWSDHNQRIANTFRQARRKIFLSQYQLAKKASINYRSVVNLEKAKPVTTVVMFKIADALQMNVEIRLVPYGQV